MRFRRLPEAEYAVLRQTISTRGTVRMALVPVAFIAWALVGSSLLLDADLPIAALFSLAVLAAGFEAVLALHLGVERIGRYLQVIYEEREPTADATSPRWETLAMVGGPSLPGGGTDPLFAVLFSTAVILNLSIVFVPGPSQLEAAVCSAVHLLMLVRIVRGRRAAAMQRKKDLDHYRALKAAGSGTHASHASDSSQP
jgi:hypothetical protein